MTMPHATTTSFETESLIDLVDRKRDCLTRLLALGRSQLELIDDDAMTSWVPLLAEKRQLLAELQRVERQLDPFRAQDPESRRWRSPADRQHCAGLIASCRALFAEIVAQEQHSNSQLHRRRNVVAVRLDAAQQARQARVAYAKLSAETTNRLDLSSDW
jgi:hypothetical protein